VVLFGEKLKNNEISNNVFEGIIPLKNKNIRCYILVIG
jgi:hypothetical protein